METLLGLAGMDSYLNQYPPDNLDRDFDFALIASLNHALESLYGARGGRGMALRLGRASFSHGIKNFGIMAGLKHPAFQALPLTDRIDHGLNAWATVLAKFCDQQTSVTEDPSTYSFSLRPSATAWGRQSDAPVCHMMVGILQETLRWSTNGYEFYVRESNCQAMGHERCVFRINKIAIGEHQPI
ncbi:4-vinyl reductase [Anaerolineales bacterium]